MLTENAISKLTIKGFKSIRELVDFELRDLNVIVGANGAGKRVIYIFLPWGQTPWQKEGCL